MKETCVRKEEEGERNLMLLNSVIHTGGYGLINQDLQNQVIKNTIKGWIPLIFFITA